MARLLPFMQQAAGVLTTPGEAFFTLDSAHWQPRFDLRDPVQLAKNSIKKSLALFGYEKHYDLPWLDHEVAATRQILAPLRRAASLLRAIVALSGTKAAGFIVDLKRHTAASFAYEWERFSVRPETIEDNFRGYFQFFSPDFWRGKRVLEAGSGMGRHTYFLSQLAHEVVAIDLGEAIRVTARNVSGCENVRLVQADIDNLPFQPESFDVVCSIGVLHHLDDPQVGLHNLIRCLRPGGTLHVYLYWALEDAPLWKRGLLDIVTAFRHLTVRLPYSVLEKLAWLVAVVGYFSFSLPYRYLSRWPMTYPLVKNLPLQRYAKDGFRVCFNDQFDRFSAPLEHRFTRRQVFELLDNTGLVGIRLQDHFGWLACGRKPESIEK